MNTDRAVRKLSFQVAELESVQELLRHGNASSARRQLRKISSTLAAIADRCADAVVTCKMPASEVDTGFSSIYVDGTNRHGIVSGAAVMIDEAGHVVSVGVSYGLGMDKCDLEFVAVEVGLELSRTVSTPCVIITDGMDVLHAFKHSLPHRSGHTFRHHLAHQYALNPYMIRMNRKAGPDKRWLTVAHTICRAYSTFRASGQNDAEWHKFMTHANLACQFPKDGEAVRALPPIQWQPGIDRGFTF